VADYRAFPNDRSLQILGGANNSGALKWLDSDLSNGPNARNGSYVIGTFFADATTQNLVLNNVSDSTQMNAIQLRTLPIPEPSAAILGGISLLALLRRRRA
jgi:hypothetical protein